MFTIVLSKKAYDSLMELQRRTGKATLEEAIEEVVLAYDEVVQEEFE